MYRQMAMEVDKDNLIPFKPSNKNVAKPTCSNCKFWVHHGHSIYRECCNVRLKAYGANQSEVTTRSDFGCNQWELNHAK